MVEGARIAEVRATKMGENLVGLGIPADRVHVTWQREPDTPDGVTDPERRRVTITLSSPRSDTLPGTQPATRTARMRPRMPRRLRRSST